jgi:hypothetical protein
MTSPHAFPIKRNPRGALLIYPLSPNLAIAAIFVFFLALEQSTPSASAAVQHSSPPPTSTFALPSTAMAPKKNQNMPGKAVDHEEELAVARRNSVVFELVLDQSDLVSRYLIMWGKETSAHTAPEVLPGSIKPRLDKYPFFTAYFYYGLVPPFSEFFVEMMYTYGFHLLDFTPNAMTCMAVFAHMCENFVGVLPSVALFRHYFTPHIKADVLSGCITWIPRDENAYLPGLPYQKWNEWRGEWCWIKEKDFPEFCHPRTARVERGTDWSSFAADDKKFTIATTGILHLKAPGLTAEMVGLTSFTAALLLSRTRAGPPGTTRMRQISCGSKLDFMPT